MAMKPIPDDNRGTTPYLCSRGPRRRSSSTRRRSARGGDADRRAGDGTVGHAELRIGEAVVMLADEHPQMNFRSPKTIGGTPVLIHLYVEDVDAVAQRRGRRHDGHSPAGRSVLRRAGLRRSKILSVTSGAWRRAKKSYPSRRFSTARQCARGS